MKKNKKKAKLDLEILELEAKVAPAKTGCELDAANGDYHFTDDGSGILTAGAEC